MDSILSNVIIVEEIDFQEYNYHPELTLYFIRHLYSGDAEFLMRILSEYFPEKVILANFLNEEYQNFQKLMSMDLENKNETIMFCREHLSIELMDLCFNTSYAKQRDDILDKKVDYKGTYESFKDCSDWLRNVVFVGKLVKCENEVWMKMENGKWIHYEPEIKCKIQSVVLNNDFEIQKPGGKSMKLDRMSHAKEICDMILMNIQQHPQLTKGLWDHTKGKLNFSNGTYNFSTDEFSRRPQGTIFMIDRAFNPKSNQKIREEIMRRIFTPIFNIRDDENGQKKFEYFMYRLARAIAGDIEDKLILMLTGNRDCGKGILSGLISNCIGDYSYAMDIGVFKQRVNSGDAAKSNSFFVPLQFRRVALMNESSKAILDGNLVKKFGSGGDPILARSNHKDEISIQIQSSGIMFCNEIPKFDTNDVFSKIKQIALTSTFVNPGFPEENKDHGVSYYESDDTLKFSFINRKDVLDEFMLMIIEAYKTKVEPPSCVDEERKEDFNEKDIIRAGFTLSENGQLSNKQFMAHIKNLKLDKTQLDAKKLLKAVFGDKIDTNKSFGGKFRGIKGLAIIEDIY